MKRTVPFLSCLLVLASLLTAGCDEQVVGNDVMLPVEKSTNGKGGGKNDEEGATPDPAFCFVGIDRQRIKGVWNELETVSVSNVDGTAIFNLVTAEPPWEKFRGPDWSPDGSAIVYQRHYSMNPGFTYDVRIVDVAISGSEVTGTVRSQPVYSVPSGSFLRDAVWSPSGSHILVSVGYGGSAGKDDFITVANTVGTSANTIYTCPSGWFIGGVAYDSDGSHIAFLEIPRDNGAESNGARIRTMTAAGEDLTTVKSFSTGKFSPNGIDWSSDDTEVAYALTETGGLYNLAIVDLTTGAATGLNADGISPSFSPDEAKVICQTENGMEVVDRANGTSTLLAAMRSIYGSYYPHEPDWLR